MSLYWLHIENQDETFSLQSHLRTEAQVDPRHYSNQWQLIIY